MAYQDIRDLNNSGVDVRDIDYSQGSRTTYPDGTVTDQPYWNDPYRTTYLQGRSGSSGSSSITQTGGQAKPSTDYAPPAAPDTSELTSLLSNVQKNTAIKDAMRDYDSLYAASQASGNQAADSAGNVYAQRLLQSGVNPVASGVVKAQAKLQAGSRLDDITKEKDATRLDAVNKSQALQAQISSALSNIRLAYSKTLADFNVSQQQLQLNLNEFNANQFQSAINSNRSYDLQERDLNARLAAAGLSGSSGGGIPGAAPGTKGVITPGYITDQGPLIPSKINGVPSFGHVIQPDAINQFGYTIGG